MSVAVRMGEPRSVAERAGHAAAIPASYRPTLHITVNLGLGVLALALALAGLSGVRAVELLMVPGTFVAMSLLEYVSHRYLMHRPTRVLPYAFKAHVLRHHASFGPEHMAIGSSREIGLILFGLREVTLFLLATLPGFALLAWFGSRNVALLAAAMVFVHFLLYEGFHLVAHLPAHHWAARQRIFASARERHARHHGDVQTNFNVTPPFADWLLDTLHRGPRS